MSPARLTPSALVRYLDQYVIGQEEAKKTIAVAVYAHLRRLETPAVADDAELAKSNLLLIGPTGSGKTLLCETLGRALGVPFVTADATALAQSKYVNAEIESILLRLLERAGGDPQRAGRGIVFIDEIDKLRRVGDQAGSSGERVQQALLKLMEGSRIRLPGGVDIDTTPILFLCGGAFVGLEHITARTHSFGFLATGNEEDQKILDRLNARIKPTDLSEFGLIPEFSGRLPIVASFRPLSRDLLMRILVEPRNALYRQFRALFAREGVELEVAPAVFGQIADLAIEYKAGARSLRGILEEMVAPALYLVPDRPDIRRVEIVSLFAAPRYDNGAGVRLSP